MSLAARREYLALMRDRYRAAGGKAEGSHLVTEVVDACAYHRKYAIRVLRAPAQSGRSAIKRWQQRQYADALSVLGAAWTALDDPCAERVHRVLLAAV